MTDVLLVYSDIIVYQRNIPSFVGIFWWVPLFVGFIGVEFCCQDQYRGADLYMLLIMLLKVIYHPLYGMSNYVLIWGDWLSCDPSRGSHDSHHPI